MTEQNIYVYRYMESAPEREGVDCYRFEEEHDTSYLPIHPDLKMLEGLPEILNLKPGDRIITDELPEGELYKEGISVSHHKDGVMLTYYKPLAKRSVEEETLFKSLAKAVHGTTKWVRHNPISTTLFALNRE
jgi:hypothetical protein